jgi:hypothetical protein
MKLRVQFVEKHETHMWISFVKDMGLICGLFFIFFENIGFCRANVTR